MAELSDEEIRDMSKITVKISADYLGISPNMLILGMRNDLLPIGFAVHNEDRYKDSWTIPSCRNVSSPIITGKSTKFR